MAKKKLPQKVYLFWDDPNAADADLLHEVELLNAYNGEVGVYVLKEVVQLREVTQVRRGRGKWEGVSPGD